MDISGEIAHIHMRTDAKNLVTTPIGRLFDKVIGEGEQFDHSSENREIIAC